MTTVIEIPKDELSARLAIILEQLGITAEEFAARSRNGTLTDADWDARDEVVSLLFLVGSDIKVD